MNNLQIFRKKTKNFLPNDQIEDKDQFKSLINYLCDNKLLHPNQVKQLISGLTDQKGNDKIQFPLTISKFQHLIMTQYGDSNCKNLIKNLQQFQKILKQTKGTLNVWKDKGLTNEQKLQLQSIFAKGNKQITELCQNLRQKKVELQSISQQQIQMISSLNQWIQMQKIQRKYDSFQDYQQHNKAIIDKLLNKIKVKEVNFKNKKKQFKDNQPIKTLQGFDSKNDQPVQVIVISKNSIDFQQINSQLLSLQALKDLFLSKHFPRYLGYNCHSDPLCYMYFKQQIDSLNLKTFITKHHLENYFNIQVPLFQYWARQIYQCFYDIFSMCSYQPNFPISLSDFQISEMGLRIILKNIKFVERRKKLNKNSSKRQIQNLQTKLLKNLGIILLEILNLGLNMETIQNNLKKIQQQTLFKTLINIEKNHQNYKQGVTPNYLSMFNVQTHSVFQAALSIQGQVVLQSYMILCGQE